MNIKLRIPDKDIVVSTQDKMIGYVFSILFIMAGTLFTYGLNHFSFAIPETNVWLQTILFATIKIFPLTLTAFSLISIATLHYIIGRKVDILDFLYAVNCNVLFLSVISIITLVIA